MIVHLNGMPGVGKLTVARHLAALLPARLLDNHLILDLVLAVCPRGTPEYGPMVLAVTEAAYRSAVEFGAGHAYVLTNALAADSSLDVARLAMAAGLAERMGVPFVPVALRCDVEENARRVASPDRASKGKLRDVPLWRELVRGCELAHDRSHPNALDVETTLLSPAQAAAVIADHVGRVRGRREQ